MLAVKVEMEGRVCEDETGGVCEPVVSQGRCEMEGSMVLFFSSIINTGIDSNYLMIRNQGAMGCFSGKEVEDEFLVSEDERNGRRRIKENRSDRKTEVDCLVWGNRQIKIKNRDHTVITLAI